MRYTRLLTPLIAFLTVVGSVGTADAGWLDKMQSMWNQVAGQSQSLYEQNWASLPGAIRICVAKELQDWIIKDVVETFKKKAPFITVTIEAHGSGELVDAMNADNSMQCDILIPGSDVAAMRWKDYNIKNRMPVAYSPTVWVGDKEKLDAARTFLKKAENAPLSCSDLAQVAAQKRYSKIKQGGKGKLDLEMTTSNSGQSMYISCVYSIVDALDPDEVEDKLNKNPVLEEQVRTFFKEVIFQQDSTTTLTIKPEGQFLHPNGISYKHLAIATYESFLPQLEQEFIKQGKVMEVNYPSVVILNNFPAVRITTEGKNGQATQAFMDYVLSEDAQVALLQFGFRPANPKVNYSSYPVSKYFRNNIEVGDAPATQQLLHDLWDIVNNIPGVQAVKF